LVSLFSNDYYLQKKINFITRFSASNNII